MIEGFGVHSFRRDATGSSTYVKFRWRPKLEVSGGGPDFHHRDLWNAIETGNPPEWELAGATL